MPIFLYHFPLNLTRDTKTAPEYKNLAASAMFCTGIKKRCVHLGFCNPRNWHSCDLGLGKEKKNLFPILKKSVGACNVLVSVMITIIIIIILCFKTKLHKHAATEGVSK